uniref:outer membrane beta-barrel protein n=1 Tax=Thaumasiovibrio occultus TaxID=1891184 RepID=UPI000B359D51|nr:outer membrane beta-barrel protein [Thaumasiovibrio occultus]
MKKLLITAAACAALSTPALAKDSGLSVGLGYNVGLGDLVDATTSTGLSLDLNYKAQSGLILGASYVPTLAESYGSLSYYSAELEMSQITPYLGVSRGDLNFFVGLPIVSYDASVTNHYHDLSASVSDTSTGIMFGLGAELASGFSATAQWSMVDIEGVDATSINFIFGYRL